MWRTWDERFWIIAAAFLGAALWYLRNRRAAAYSPDEREKYRRWSKGAIWIFVFFLIVRAVIGLFAGERWGLVPETGLFVTLCVGGVLGIFLASFALSVYRADASLKDVWAAALALVALSVAYSLPVYHSQIAAILRDSGLSSLKISVADVTLEAALSSKGSQGQISATGGATGSVTQSVIRFSDPTPGLQVLYYDLLGDAQKPKEKLTIFDRDKRYVSFLQKDTSQEFKDIDKASRDARTFLKPVTLLVACLDEYTKRIRDSQLLLIDMKSSIGPLFLLHGKLIEKAKAGADSKQPLPLANDIYTAQDFKALKMSVMGTIRDAQRTLKPGEEKTAEWMTDKPSVWIDAQKCEDALKELGGLDVSSVKLSLYQPYVTMVLASLLQAHGATDEAVAVLGEWLWAWKQLVDYNDSLDDKARLPLPGWYRIDILGRLQVILENIAGSSNRAFRDILEEYRDMLNRYLDQAEGHPVRLADIPARCQQWENLFSARDGKEEDLETQRRLAYVLWGTESDSLRTELSFVPEENSFEGLEGLRRRAQASTEIADICLPQTGDLFTKQNRTGVVAEGRIISGLVALAVSERMSALAGSPDDRNRVTEVHKLGEEWLITGWADLQPIWHDAVELQKKKPWADRIFGGTRWDRTATLVLRVLSRLHQGE